MAHRPVGLGTSFATSSTSAQSTSFSVQSNVLRVVATGGNTFVAIGTNPTATTGDYLVPSGTSATLALTKASNRVVGVTTGTTTTIIFAEGTQCPFGVGDYVTLTANGQSYYDFTHQPVISVDTSSGYDGYHQTRCSIDTNTSGILTAFSSVNATLTNSLKVAARTDTGTGVLYLQQVQISGQA
jgi:hypothetical protein